MYLAVLALGVVGLLNRNAVLLVLIALVFYLGPVASHFSLESRPHKVLLIYLPRFALMFFSGTAILLHAEQIVLDWRIFLVAVALVIGGFRFNWGYWTLAACLPYIIMYVAFADLPRLRALSRPGDFSYGVYVYAFPIQQMLANSAWSKSLPMLPFFLLAVAGTLLLAIPSWFLIERPALLLKGKRLFTLHPFSGGPESRVSSFGI